MNRRVPLAIPVAAALVAVLVVVLVAMRAAHDRSDVSAQQTRVAEMAPRAAAASQAVNRAIDENAAKGVGVSATRTDRDTAIIGSLVSTAFTWDSGSSYTAARTTLLHQYGLAASNSVITAFVPVSRSAEDYQIDQTGLSSQVDGTPRITLATTVRGVNTYVVSVAVRSTAHGLSGDDPSAAPSSSSDTASSTRTNLLRVGIDASGRVTHASGVAGVGATQVSQDLG